MNSTVATSALVPINGKPPLVVLAEHGFARARDTHAIQPHMRDLQSLTEYAENMARMVARPPYDPETIPADRVREDLYTDTRGMVPAVDEALEIATRRAASSVDAEGEARSRLGASPRRPIVALAAGVTTFALSTGPSVHDFVLTTISDDLLNWFLSLALTAIAGAMLAWGFLSVADDSRTPRIAGIVIALGIALVRLSGAETVRDVAFAAGLTVMDIGVVMFMGWRARAYNSAAGAHAEQASRADAAAATAAVACAERDRLRAERQRLDDLLHEHVDYLERCAEFAGEESARAGAYVRAVRDGYLGGIGRNRGELYPLN